MCCVQTKHCLLVSKKEHNSFIVAVVQYKGRDLDWVHWSSVCTVSNDKVCMVHCGRDVVDDKLWNSVETYVHC